MANAGFVKHTNA